MKYIVQKWNDKLGWIMYGGVVHSCSCGAISAAIDAKAWFPNDRFRPIGFVELLEGELS